MNKRNVTVTLMGLAILALFVLLSYCASRPDAPSPTPTAPVAPSATPTDPSTNTPVALPTASQAEPLPTTAPAPAEAAFTAHTVQAGDTLLGLAMTYAVPMAAIQMHNQMGSSTIVQAGQTLSIPPQVGWEGASPFWVLYVVEAGETLVGIAAEYGLSAGDIQAVNGLTNADLIGIGQELILPLSGPALAAAPPPTATPVPPTAVPVPEASVTAAAVAEPSATPVPAAPPPSDVAAWPYEVVRIINDVRAQHGLWPLAYNETLAAAAQGHANDCSQRGWCSHTGSDGSDVNTRIVRAGYNPAGRAECWAMSLSPQHAVDMWMDEVPPNDPHRRTLLTTYQTEIGVGIAGASWDYFYFIADFGRPQQ
ncbi:MAG: LysM peptidoglycan-binding domain-containing protein [Anaerolineae bacterium]|nr:LysM peptidoglycan-binding domain-containing protein [Anaerolineae bacterium]